MANVESYENLIIGSGIAGKFGTKGRVSEARGPMKVLVAKNSDEILAFTAFGFERAS
jgi:hypothetical protein